MNIKRILLITAVLAVPLSGLSVAEEMKGRILGEKCAQMGKIGECYMGWANPMVFWIESGDYYHIEFGGKGQAEEADECTPEKFCWQGEELDQVTLDKGFGQEVQVDGKIIDAERIQLSKLTLLNPPGKKEFFKG
ncbi:MAG: hypothetical protein GY731_02005 [Gammaproteobacteria bacterium]|nr:hypothetical protein [Gammaproteobacteria bacterium]